MGTSVSKTRHHWPDFFIVGAARAGTTSLHHYLKQHPAIYMPAVKELHFFTAVKPAHKRLYLEMKVTPSEEDYLRFFEDARDDQLAGEACPSYLYDPETPARIRAKVPAPRIIIILRDPVERAYSHYLMEVREGMEQRGFQEACEEDYASTDKTWGAARLYIDIGLYYQQVKRYLDTFGPDLVRIYLYEDLVADTKEFVSDVCRFLGVASDSCSFFDESQRFNVYATPRNFLKGAFRSKGLRSLAIRALPKAMLSPVRDRLVLKKDAKPPIDPLTREFLNNIFQEDVQKLQGLIGRDPMGWLQTAP